ncbi:hypothetical protein PB1_15514 [Bacillus methanolicus PB1]|uniref:Uncharacterized protein n=1 Tax=Bacillus methanolicus PB1 TaxID=997296 RepID=I3DXK8_BACMT|nr:hypothetical protein PB1_15514 [Bacillus methanolicus PB1]
MDAYFASIIRVVPRVQLSSLSGDESFLCCEDDEHFRKGADF